MRIFRSVFVLFLLLGVIASIYLHYHIDGIVKNALESYGSRILGVNVRVDDVAVSLLDQKITLKGLKIENPKGFKDEYFFKAAQIDLRLDLLSIFKDTINIDNLSIHEPNIVYEGMEGNNLKTLIKNLENNEESTQSNTTSTNNSKELLVKKNKNLIIHEVIVQGANVQLNVGKYMNHGVQLGNFSLRNIGIDEGGIKADKITEQLIEKIIGEVEKIDFKTIFPNMVGNAISDVTKGVEGQLKKVGDTIDKMLNTK
jgi:hypothetical protein